MIPEGRQKGGVGRVFSQAIKALITPDSIGKNPIDGGEVSRKTHMLTVIRIKWWTRGPSKTLHWQKAVGTPTVFWIFKIITIVKQCP